MSYCPKCGKKVDETMTFCPNCGASLKTATYQGAPSPPVYPRYRNEKQEKHEKQEKGEKHEKGQGGMVGWLIAGLILVFFGVVAYTNILYHWVPNGPEAAAIWLVAIGIIIIVVGIYFATRARRRFPDTT
jgi:cytochrome c biogenesis protein CcdA